MYYSELNAAFDKGHTNTFVIWQFFWLKILQKKKKELTPIEAFSPLAII